MFCKKCGFKLSEGTKICPFCKSDQEELEKQPQPEFVKKETNYYRQEESENQKPKYDDYISVEDEFAVASGIRTTLGYVNLKTKFWHHALLACAGYLIMNLLFIFVGAIILGYYKAQGLDFSLLEQENCPIEVINAYNMTNLVTQVLCELAIVAVTIVIFRKYLKLFFTQFKDSKTFKWFGIGFLMMYGMSFAYQMILELFQLVSTSSNQDSVNETVTNSPILGFLFVVIAAPLFEEIIFRLGVFRSFANKSKKMEIVGLVVTTILFALIHMGATVDAVFADPNNPDIERLKSDLLSLPSYLIGAFSLTFAYYKSKNLATPILMHMSWNLLGFVGMMMPTTDPSTSVEAITNLFNTVSEFVTRLF